MMETVVFDVDDTLYDQLTPFQRAFETCFPEYNHVPMQELFVSSRKHSDILFEATETGSIPLLDLHIYRITAACKEFEIEIVHEDALRFQQLYEVEQHKITLNSNIRELLNYFTKRGKQLAILTNGPTLHQEMKINRLGIQQWIPKDHIFISETIGVAKPNLRAFQLVEEVLQCNRETTVYIGDSFENDVVGAKQAGWHSIWLNHRKKITPISPFRPDFIVQSTNELLSLTNKYL